MAIRPLAVFSIRFNASGTLIEFPLSTIRIAGTNLPMMAGGYLRLFPYALMKFGINRMNVVEKKPSVLAFHPWELDPHQPLPRVSRLKRFPPLRQLGYDREKTSERAARLQVWHGEASLDESFSRLQLS